MKWVLNTILSSVAVLSCSLGSEVSVPRSISLPGVVSVPGKHCESSAILNMLNYLGYSVHEYEITGGGGALSFMFIKDTFPFIAARNQDMKEQFFTAARLTWHQGSMDDANGGWDRIYSVMAKGIPVVLRVDMRFLPYRYGGKIGPQYMSFGAHYITLFGIDLDRGVALVSDTEFLELQEVSLKNINRARMSKTKNFPPNGEFYWIDRPVGSSPQIDIDALITHSITTVLENYETTSLANLASFPADIEGFSSWSTKTFLYPAVLEYMAGNIEDHGTGGASFRCLYRDFIEGVSRKSMYGEHVASLLPLCDESIAQWHRLAAEFHSLSTRVKGLSREEREREFSALAEIARGLYDRESALYQGIKALTVNEW